MDGFDWDERIEDAEGRRCQGSTRSQAERSGDYGQQELSRHRERRRQTGDPAFQQWSRKSSTVRSPLVGLMATANSTAGTTDRMGPMF
jgi:hypothetical protein